MSVKDLYTTIASYFEESEESRKERAAIDEHSLVKYDAKMRLVEEKLNSNHVIEHFRKRYAAVLGEGKRPVLLAATYTVFLPDASLAFEDVTEFERVRAALFEWRDPDVKVFDVIAPLVRNIYSTRNRLCAEYESTADSYKHAGWYFRERTSVYQHHLFEKFMTYYENVLEINSLVEENARLFYEVFDALRRYLRAYDIYAKKAVERHACLSSLMRNREFNPNEWALACGMARPATPLSPELQGQLG